MSLKLFAGGDYVNQTGNSLWIADELAATVKDADISIINFEAPIETDGMNPIPKAGPHLYQHKKSVEYLKSAGFNFVSLANNHIYDYGQIGLENTINRLKENNIEIIGGGGGYNEAYKAKIFSKNNISVGLLAACENEFGCLYEDLNRGGYAWLFSATLEDEILKLKNNVHYIVLIAHAGVEDISFPIKEWRDRYKRLCNLGVNVIIGHHPHVPQGWERYNHSLIFYSLGNFYFDTSSFKNNSDDSYSVMLEFGSNNFQFKTMYHKKSNLKVELTNDVNFDLESLNKLLDADYEKMNRDTCVKLFHDYYYGYYQTALRVIPANASFVQRLKHVIKKIIRTDKFRASSNLLLLHNIRIDSHRFVVQRALSELYEK